MIPTCKGCKYYGVKGEVSECRRYPPTVTALLVPGPPTPASPHGSVGIQVMTLYPQVGDAPACGEFTARLLPLP